MAYDKDRIVQDLRYATDDAEAYISELTDTVDELESEVRDLEIQVEGLKDENDGLQEEISRLEEEAKVKPGEETE
jgi:peptidoglycan hydrolase CwlO-like protein